MQGPKLDGKVAVITGASMGIGEAFAKELAQMPWGKFASFLDADGNEFGIRSAWQK